jgi:U3 small nucleolar RNA-associated protein 23
MITTCDMRHLYNASPKNETLILQAKEYERRRCNHQDLEEPLSTLECLGEVVDPKGSHTNKNRYIVASNDKSVRARMRGIAGVPLIYINKSVVLMEPMANATEEQREREEKSKFRQGLKGQRKPDTAQKRKRDDDEEEEDGEGQDAQAVTDGATEDARLPKKRRQKGPKQPNPLSMKKAKKDNDSQQAIAPKKSRRTADDAHPLVAETDGTIDGETSGGRKRKRKPKSKGNDNAPGEGQATSP